MSKWAGCGDGFCDIDNRQSLRGKFARIRSEKSTRNASTSIRNRTSVSLQEKTSKVKSRKIGVNDDSGLSGFKKEEEIISEFELTSSAAKGVPSLEDDDISWDSASSSDQQEGCEEQRVARKRRASSSDKNKLSSEKKSTKDTSLYGGMHFSHKGGKSSGFPETMDKSWPVVGVRRFLQTVPQKIDASNEAVGSHSHFQNQERKVSWTRSAFEDIDGSPTKRKTSKNKETCLVKNNKSLSKARSGVIGKLSDKLCNSANRALDFRNDDDKISEVDSSEESSVEKEVSNDAEVVDSDDSSDVADETQNKEDRVSIDISSGTSVSPISGTDKATICASEWVTALQKQKTPLKKEQGDCLDLGDSAKKKKKHSRGSLAGQLSRLLNREKSSIRFWYHSASAGSLNEEANKLMTLQLLTLRKQCMLYISKCQVLKPRGNEEGKECKALFSSDTVDKLCLRAGMTIKLFPSWQQLEDSKGNITLLCTHYAQVISKVPEQWPVHCEEPQSSVADKLVTLSFSWKCPCSKDAHIPNSLCPAELNPVSYCNLLQTSDCVTPTSSHLAKTAVLHTVSRKQHQLLHDSKKTLLESIEGLLRGDDTLPPFTASVLRVFRQRHTDTKKLIYELLVEDDAGTMAILKLSDKVSREQVSMLQHTYCSCSGFIVVSRINKDRDPALFHLVDKVWSRRFLFSSSQVSNSDSSQQMQCLTRCPSFCYVLEVSPGLKPCIQVLKDTAKNYATGMQLLALHDISQSQFEHQRVSFVARVLRMNDETTYVFDNSKIVECSLLLRLSYSDACVLDRDFPESSIYLFQDVLWEKDHLLCDGLSLVLTIGTWEQWGVYSWLEQSLVDTVQQCSLILAHLSELSSPGDLVRVEGTVSAIDESSAYSWEECDRCGSDKLSEMEPYGTYVCMACKERVAAPIIKMKMGVSVSCTDMPKEWEVTIDLTQKTIENLLPAEKEDEGHDVNLVLGLPVCAPVCLVEDKLPQVEPVESLRHQTLLRLKELNLKG